MPTAKVFSSGNSQTVRIPAEFQFDTDGMEIFWQGDELVRHCDFKSRDEARATIFNYIELFHNRTKIHQFLGHVSPVQFEKLNAVLV